MSLARWRKARNENWALNLLSNAAVPRLGSVSAQESSHSSVEYQRFAFTKSKSTVRPETAVHFICEVLYMFVFVFWLIIPAGLCLSAES